MLIKLSALVTILVSISTPALAQPLVVPIPDSPEHYTYSNNTYTELGWHAQTVTQHQGVAGFTLDYTWDTIDPAGGFFGTFYAQSPSGTIIHLGFAESSGTYSKSFNDFDQQWADGDWIFIVEDVDGFGEQRAVDITWTLDLIDGLQPFNLINTVHRDSVILTWSNAVDDSNLTGYRIYRDNNPIADIPANQSTYIDTPLALGNYCYKVVAIQSGAESAPTDTVCSQVFPLGTYGLEDGPTEWFRYNSYFDNDWTDLQVFDQGILADVTIAGTWHNNNGFHDGTLHIESPSGTLWETHYTGMDDGPFSFTIPDFAGEEAQGDWKVWLEDSDAFGDGYYSVSDTTISFQVDYQVPTQLSAQTIEDHIDLAWSAPENAAGLAGYLIHRDDQAAPIATLPSSQTTYTDNQLCAQPTYTYTVTAQYAKSDSQPSLPASVGAPGVIAITDSPLPNQPNTYWYNSWTEAGWDEFTVPDHGTIDTLQMNFTWDANWAVPEGRFYLRSPSGTIATLIHGDDPGQYSIELNDFNGEPSAGTWRAWIVDNDFFYDGMFRATNITLLFDPPTNVDFNNDGTLDFFDISAFLTLFGNNDPQADMTSDGQFDFFDISAFLTAFSSGC